MNDIGEIYRRFLSGRCSPQEVERLLHYFDKHPQSTEILELIQQEFEKEDTDALSQLDSQFIAETRARLGDELSKSGKTAYPHFRIWIAVAASLILFAIGNLLYFYRTSLVSAPTVTAGIGQEVQPGGNRAFITLANGIQVALDSSRSAVTTNNGKFYYEDDSVFLNADATQLATLSTPIGGTYRLILPDGTKVWLNAKSSVTYPLRFTGNERSIKLSGEAYLEVAPDRKNPFIVESEQQRIRVLGTAFNLRTYENRIITTLLHGKIALESKRTGQPIILLPGDQVMLNEEHIHRSKVDPLDYIAWTEGTIFSKDATLKDITKELERWYDVNFVFLPGAEHSERAIININRTEILSAVLQALEDTYQVKFTIKGKEVFVK